MSILTREQRAEYLAELPIERMRTSWVVRCFEETVVDLEQRLVALAADYQDAMKVRERVLSAIAALDAAGDDWTGAEIVVRARLTALLGEETR